MRRALAFAVLAFTASINAQQALDCFDDPAREAEYRELIHSQK